MSAKRIISDFFKPNVVSANSLGISERSELTETVNTLTKECDNDNIEKASCSYSKKRKIEDDTVQDVSILVNDNENYDISELDTMHARNADKSPTTDLAQSLDEPPRQPKTRFGSDLRYFRSKFYKIYPWIEYSILKDELFCYPCRFFSMQGTGSLKTFISEGYKNWKRASETKDGFKYHDNSFQHKSAMVAWQSFKCTKNNETVATQISTGHTELILQNRKYIKSIIRCIIYLSTQGPALRGHDEFNASQNRGNFLELLDLMSHDNTVIAKRLIEGPKNARYTHYSIQNELIHCLAEQSVKHISSEVKEAGYFALTVDETKDLSKTEQLSIIIRNVSDYLQSKDSDILKSLALVESLKQVFISYRQDSEFEKLWTAVLEDASANNINLNDVNIKRSTKLPSKFNKCIIIQKITSLEEDRCVITKSEFQKQLTPLAIHYGCDIESVETELKLLPKTIE
ncbi:zinc finger mym-type protein [Holotrichia oblita]|uniref:Zinc finger mym-type protein n=1 Tax=Holotrichia oblita TaxID=644536 RepID=A0ACB9TYP6_HOLOL|nr:zinc finger mym-type protein [Holotrichia oblita]